MNVSRYASQNFSYHYFSRRSARKFEIIETAPQRFPTLKIELSKIAENDLYSAFVQKLWMMRLQIDRTTKLFRIFVVLYQFRRQILNNLADFGAGAGVRSLRNLFSSDTIGITPANFVFVRPVILSLRYSCDSQSVRTSFLYIDKSIFT